MIQSVDEIGHFQRVLLKITYFLLKVSVALVSVCLIYLIAKGESFLEAIAFAVCLLVASIPIAMQVVCTTTMALGSRKLAEQKAIVARLSSIEQLAGMTMLCSDKTGTLTLNKMVLQDVFLYEPGVDRCARLDCEKMSTNHTAESAKRRASPGSVEFSNHLLPVLIRSFPPPPPPNPAPPLTATSFSSTLRSPRSGRSPPRTRSTRSC